MLIVLGLTIISCCNWKAIHKGAATVPGPLGQHIHLGPCFGGVPLVWKGVRGGGIYRIPLSESPPVEKVFPPEGPPPSSGP